MTKLDDPTRLGHMLESARMAMQFIEGETRVSLETDKKLVLALVKLIEIVGEAANNVSLAKQAELPDIPWRQIIGMRNRIVHAYFDVDLDIVWRTVTEELPPLIAVLEKVVG
jgi:uncharacterized protein with HEPN domain